HNAWNTIYSFPTYLLSVWSICSVGFIFRSHALWYLAIEGGQGLVPFFFRGSLAGAEVYTKGAEIGGAARLRGVRKDVGTPGDLKIYEAGHDHRGLQLCFQQSTCNSAGPQVYLPFGAHRHGLLHQDVAYLQASARLEHPRHLL